MKVLTHLVYVFLFMAEYTNKIAPDPGRIRENSKRVYAQPSNSSTLRVHIAERSRANLAWPDVTNPWQNHTDVPVAPTPMAVRCFYCNDDVTTVLSYKPGGLTWVLCCLVAAVGGFLGCCFLPFFVKLFNDVLHSCPKCQAHLAVYYRV